MYSNRHATDLGSKQDLGRAAKATRRTLTLAVLFALEVERAIGKMIALQHMSSQAPRPCVQIIRSNGRDPRCVLGAWANGLWRLGHRERAAELSWQAVDKEDAYKERRKTKSATPEESARMEADWKGTLPESREARAKAEPIEDAVFDVKAVNPNRTNNDDHRTPAELLASIEQYGREADAALQRLRELIIAEGVASPKKE